MNFKFKTAFKFSSLMAVTAGIGFSLIAACSNMEAKAKPNFVTKPAPKPGIVAKINGEEITEEMLIGDDKLDFLEIKKREYDLKMDRLNRMLVERIIGAEAKKANLSVDDFIDKKILKGDIKVSDSEYNKFVKDKKIPETQINPQIKDRIHSFIKQTKRQEMVESYLAKMTKSNPVEVYFTKPKLAIDVDAGNAPFMGGKDAKVTIVEFSDFQCPFCSKGADVMTEVKKKYGNKVKIAFKHFPLPMHREAKPASEASMCVHEQNADKFWKYHDLLFKNQDKFDAANLEKFAKDVGANIEKFKECLSSNKYSKYVDDDMAYGEKIGVRSTPTFFVNGQLVSGAVPLEQFSEIIDEELKGN